MMAPIFAIADPEKAGNLIKKFQALVYPEDRFNDLKYMRKAQDYFKKMRDVDLRINVIH